MVKIGTMQGRLSPPSSGKFQSYPKFSWREESYKAKKCNLNTIEGIFEAYEWENNPISSGESIDEIKKLVNGTGIEINSLCADYFMDLPLLRVGKNEVSNMLVKEHSIYFMRCK